MAYTIVSTCIACDLCVPQCPIDAISVVNRKYVIDQDLCCDFEDCLAVCPVNAIVPSATILSASDGVSLSKVHDSGMSTLSDSQVASQV